MTSLGISDRVHFAMRTDGRRLLRLFASISTLYGAWFIFSMDEYLPWQVRFAKGVEMTLIGHLGLWLATFEWRSRWRFVIAAIFLPSIVALFFLWWNIHLVVAIAALGGMSWLMFQVIRGKSLGN